MPRPAPSPTSDSQRLQAPQFPQRLGGDPSQQVVLQHPVRGRGGLKDPHLPACLPATLEPSLRAQSPVPPLPGWRSRALCTGLGECPRGTLGKRPGSGTRDPLAVCSGRTWANARFPPQASVSPSAAERPGYLRGRGGCAGPRQVCPCGVCVYRDNLRHPDRSVSTIW